MSTWAGSQFDSFQLSLLSLLWLACVVPCCVQNVVSGVPSPVCCHMRHVVQLMLTTIRPSDCITNFPTDGWDLVWRGGL